MTKVKQFLILGVIAASLLVPTAPPASADHNTACATHNVPAVTTGTVSSTNQQDWWSHTVGAIPVTTISLTMTGGDADLYVYNPCGTLVCSSASGGTTTDVCPNMIGTGTYRIRVQWWSGTPSYTLSITHP